MAEYLIQDSTLTDIADAIRAKTGSAAGMTPVQMVTAIGSIPTGGGGGLELLASGSFTLASEGVAVSIPVSFTGNPVNVFVIFRGDGTGVAHTHAWAFMASYPLSELDTLFPASSDKGVRSAVSMQASGTTTITNPIRARFEQDNTIIDVRRTGSSYPCLAGEYAWYIYGEAAT